MSFDEYVHSMTQKYRLAIAVAVLKSKPIELTVEQYIEKLKTKYNKNADMEIDHDNIDMTICSDDFQLDDDDIEKLNDSFHQSLSTKETGDKDSAKMSILDDLNTQDNIERVTRNNSFMNVFRTLRDIDENGSTQNKENPTFVPPQTSETTCYEDSQLLEFPTVNINTIVNANNDNEDINELSKNRENTDMNAQPNDKENTVNNNTRVCDNNIYDSQGTEIYSMAMTQNYSHVSQSQFDDVHIPRQYLYAKGHDKRNIENEIESDERYNANAEKDKTNAENSQEQNGGHFNNVISIDDVIEDVRDIEIPFRVDNIDAADAHSNELDETMTLAPPNNTQGFEDNSYTENTEQLLQKLNENATTESTDQLIQNLYENTKTGNTEHLIQKLNETLSVHNVDPSQIQYIIDSDGKMYRILHIPHQTGQNNIVFNQINNKPQTIQTNNSENYPVHGKQASNYEESNTKSQENNDNHTKVTEEIKHVATNVTDSCINVKTIQDTNVTNTKEICDKVTTGNHDTSTKETCENNHTVDENMSQNTISDQSSSDSEDTVESQAVVSFKVIEELNRIKTYLSRNVERRNMDASLTDSGYKSDSQKSVRSAQTPSNWLNQSAFCLYRHLLDCSLTNSTQDITSEISQVLSNLVDRLHEDEYYPPFLGDMLGTIDNTIVELCHGDSYGKDVLLKKDEQIQRLCLLNKSVHILKYTIEKLTDKLDKTYSNLTQNDTLYETTDIDVCENVCYVFHVLEMCLQRYMKAKQAQDTDKQVQSQNSTQNSQDEEKEKLLKKSTIADIWRKKWIPNYKEDVLSDICMEKRCVLTKCGEVLNKIIVGCMEGYSLVSFAALQCFNLLQNQ